MLRHSAVQPDLVTSLSAEPLDLPLNEPFTIATGSQTVARNVLVRVELASGERGLGEAAPFPAVSGETQEQTLAAIQQLSALVVGASAQAWRSTAARLASAAPRAAAARCGIEMAMVDALAQHQGLPLWRFFGGAGATLDTDMTVTAGDVAHAAASAAAIVKRGINTLKVKIGASEVAADVERMQAIHDAAPRARLLADANAGYTLAQAGEFLRGLSARRIPLALFEQPLPVGELTDWQALARQSSVPLCADESARSTAAVEALARSGAVRVVNIKLMKCGVSEALTMVAAARQGGLSLMIGGMVESILAMTFSAHFAAGLGGFAFADLDTPLFIAEHPFQGGFVQNGEHLSLVEVRAGNGVTLR